MNLKLIGFQWSAANINTNLQYNHLEQKVKILIDLIEMVILHM